MNEMWIRFGGCIAIGVIIGCLVPLPFSIILGFFCGILWNRFVSKYLE